MRGFGAILLVACGASCQEDLIGGAWFECVDDTDCLVGWTCYAPARVCIQSSADAESGFVRIEPGTFSMGTPNTEAGRLSDEGRHTVAITKPFFMKAMEVTQSEWLVMFGNRPSSHIGCESCPVERVQWFEAVAFANAMSDEADLPRCYVMTCTGLPGEASYECSHVLGASPACPGYRLPTEAEWEYAARAGTVEERYGWLDAIAWYSRNANESQNAGLKAANPWGLSDVLGNVMEWCDDGYAPYVPGEQSDPTGDPASERRVMRGGSWRSAEGQVRAGARASYPPGERGDGSGFRLVRSAP